MSHKYVLDIVLTLSNKVSKKLVRDHVVRRLSYTAVPDGGDDGVTVAEVDKVVVRSVDSD